MVLLSSGWAAPFRASRRQVSLVVRLLDKTRRCGSRMRPVCDEVVARYIEVECSLRAVSVKDRITARYLEGGCSRCVCGLHKAAQPNQALHLTGDVLRGSTVLGVGRASSCVSPAGELCRSAFDNRMFVSTDFARYQIWNVAAS